MKLYSGRYNLNFSKLSRKEERGKEGGGGVWPGSLQRFSLYPSRAEQTLQGR